MALLGITLALCATLSPQTPARPQSGPAAADGILAMRVASTDAEPLLGYLVRRFETGSEHPIGKRACSPRAIDERRDCWFFDDARMSLLDSGRQTQLVVRSQPDGKRIDACLQARIGSLLLNVRDGLDPAAAARTEDPAPLESFLQPQALAAVRSQFAQHDLKTAELRVSMRIDEKVVGLALGDGAGDLLRFTVRRVSCREADMELQWHEFHAEVIATEDQDAAAAATELRAALLAELAAQKARLLREVEGDYQRAFAHAQAATWLPLRWLHGSGIRAVDGKIAAMLAASAACAAIASTLAVTRARRARAVNTA